MKLEDAPIQNDNPQVRGRSAIKKKKIKILILRSVIAFILCALASGLGAASFILLRNIELQTFQRQFNSAQSQIQSTVTHSLNEKFVAHSLVQNIYKYGIQTGAMGTLPNVTLFGFEAIMNDVVALATCRGISWNPLVVPETRRGWESYAQRSLGLVTGTNVSDARKYISNWVIGPYNKTSGSNVRVGNVISGSPAAYRSMLFPVWQMAPIKQNYKAIFLEPHSFVGSRQDIIDLGLAARQGGFTDLLQLVQDTTPRPSSTLYAPMYGLPTDKNDPLSAPLIGLFAGVFSWDTLFRSSLPNYLERIDCVLSSKTTTYHLAIEKGVVSVVGKGDFHDEAFSQYAKSFTTDTSAFSTTAVTAFTITVYPTSNFYKQYVTEVPVNVCIVVVAIMVVTMIIIVVYDYMIRRRESKLINKAEEAEDTTKLVASMLPAHLSKNNAQDLKALSVALKSQLDTHPVHRAILDGLPDRSIERCLEEDPASAKDKVEGRTAFDFVVQRDDGCANGMSDASVGTSVVIALLLNSLPVDRATKLPLLPAEHGHAWVTAVQYDRYESSIAHVLHTHPLLAPELAGALDSEGRRAVNIASPKCKRLIMQFQNFHKRYEIKSFSRAHHNSATCTLHLAVDHEDQMRPVALKFMKYRDQFFKEIRTRSQGNLSDDYVVGLLRFHDLDDDLEFALELKRKELHAFPYLLVMDAGERSLADVLNKENIAGREWHVIRTFSVQIGKCLAHLHDHGFIHGDIKPLNIMRMGHGFKLIDLDTSCRYSGGEEFACSKFSSGYVPPECIYRDGDVVCVRSPLCRYMSRTAEFTVFFAADASVSGRQTAVDERQRRGGAVAGHVSGPGADVIPLPVDGRRVDDAGNAGGNAGGNGVETGGETVDAYEGEDDGSVRLLDFDLVQADPSQDMWAFGVVLYHMAAKCSLFNCDYAGNIVGDGDICQLHEWTDSSKLEKLSHIPDKYARNLISQLLTKQPAKRPTIHQVLSHPFMTGVQATRMQGDSAEFDVFLSYRVHSDLPTAELLYDALTSQGLKVWWDKKCLLPGEPWEEGFCKGLVSSVVFLPVYSREAVNHPTNLRQSFGLLTANSPCDNMYLEQRLALELRDRGLIEKIFPLFVGEKQVDGSYVRYQFQTDHPSLPDVRVASVEDKLIGHLEGQGLGLPYHMDMTVADVVGEITKYQGNFVEGTMTECFANAVVPAVTKMLHVRIRDVVNGRAHGRGAASTRNSFTSSTNTSAHSTPEDGRFAIAAAAIHVLDGDGDD